MFGGETQHTHTFCKLGFLDKEGLSPHLPNYQAYLSNDRYQRECSNQNKIGNNSNDVS